MPHFRRSYSVARTPNQVFDVVGTHVFDNHPKWEKEVVEIRPITPGPVRQGSRAVMVREERGRRSETPYEVIEFEPGRLIAFRHDTAAMGFVLRFELAPNGATGTDLTVDATMTPHGLLRLASPLLALEMPRRSNRIATAMVALVEGRADQQPTVSMPVRAAAGS